MPPFLDFEETWADALLYPIQKSSPRVHLKHLYTVSPLKVHTTDPAKRAMATQQTIRIFLFLNYL